MGIRTAFNRYVYYTYQVFLSPSFIYLLRTYLPLYNNLLPTFIVTRQSFAHNNYFNTI